MSDEEMKAMPSNPSSPVAPSDHGLSDQEARERLEREGLNELFVSDKRPWLGWFLETVRDPMLLMLVAAGVLYTAMGEPTDALVLLGSVAIVLTITVVQQRRTERALEALRDLSSPRALVIRDGVQCRIPGREVVRGDRLILAEGDRVPADALLRRGTNLNINESLLTGESVPVSKVSSMTADALGAAGGDGSASLFAGTLVTTGQGVADVIATGPRTQMGQIGKALARIEVEPTPLRQEMSTLVRKLAAVGIIGCCAVVAGYAWTRGGDGQAWKEGLLAGITMAMAILPEEIPVVMTVFFALGAWRISRNRVLTRRMPVIEALGAATVLCVDKTGTLTLNQMSVRSLSLGGHVIDLAHDEIPRAEVRALLEIAILASKPDAFDPMEQALIAAGRAFEADFHTQWSLVREYPLTPELPVVAHAWQTRAGDDIVAAKGAPEAIAELCRLTREERVDLAAQAVRLASEGLRVLGIARAVRHTGDFPENQRDLGLAFLGLIAFEDPLRESVPDAISECRGAGVRVVMMTGDHPTTAQSIAKAAGLSGNGRLITGPELDAMSDDELAHRLAETSVFARVMPKQKLRIVTALQAQGEVVAMTGDGVNDAPALKAAQIGIAMGGRGTDVAREAASLVLLDDDFSSIVAAIRVGRRIFDNIKKAIAFIIAVHVPIAGISLAPVFLPGWPLMLLPMHVAFLELIIDPSCTLVFEAEPAEADVMRRPPRRSSRRLLPVRTLGIAVAQGAVVLAACMTVATLALRRGTDDIARTMMFTTLVLSFLGVIVVERSWGRSLLALLRTRNVAFRWVAGITLVLLATALFLPGARRAFHFERLELVDFAIAIGTSLACLPVLELAKRFLRRR